VVTFVYNKDVMTLMYKSPIFETYVQVFDLSVKPALCTGQFDVFVV